MTHFHQRGLLSGSHCFLFWGWDLKSSFKFAQSEGMRDRPLALLSQALLYIIYQESTNENPQVFRPAHFGSYSVFKIGQLC